MLRWMREDPSLNHRQRTMLRRALRLPDSEFRIGYHRTAHGIAYATAVNNGRGGFTTANVADPDVVAAASPLARDAAMRDWINAYVPGTTTAPPVVPDSNDNALWAADVWYSIKKHWVLEAQQAIRTRRNLSDTTH